MQITEPELMTIASWLAVFEAHYVIQAYEYEIMAKLAEASGNMESANHYMQKYHEAFAEEEAEMAVWQAEEEAEARAM